MRVFHNFALGDLFYSDKKHQEEMAKLDALNTIATKSTTTNALVYIIPAIGLVGMLVLIAISMKKKRAS